jgi:hypothetical protein
VKAYGRQIVVMLIGLAALAAPAAANASVTIGSNLAATPAPSGVFCSNQASVPCTTSSIALPADRTAPGGLLAPSDGVVVRWRIKVGDAVTPVAFRITRPGNSSTRTGAGTGPTVTPAADSISTYEVQIPIQAGDAVGIDCCVAATLDATTGEADASLGIWNPRLQDGEAPRSAGSQFSGEVLVNADIEPDCDSDGLGDETQDPSLLGGNCPVPGAGPGAQLIFDITGKKKQKPVGPQVKPGKARAKNPNRKVLSVKVTCQNQPCEATVKGKAKAQGEKVKFKTQTVSLQAGEEHVLHGVRFLALRR